MLDVVEFTPARRSSCLTSLAAPSHRAPRVAMLPGQTPAQTIRAENDVSNALAFAPNALQASPDDGKIELMLACVLLVAITMPPPSGTVTPGQATSAERTLGPGRSWPALVTTV